MSKKKKAHLSKRSSEHTSKIIDLFGVGILNSLSSHICVVAADGEIIAINRSWSQFGYENGGTPQALNEGSNYFEACQKAIDRDGLQAASRAIQGIKTVLNGQTSQFEMEYDCHSPDEKRWFVMRVSPMQFRGNKAVISHINITEKKRVEEELAALHAVNMSVRESIHLKALTQKILEQLSSVVKPDLCLVFLREGEELNLQGSYPNVNSTIAEENHIHRVGNCLCGLSVSSGESVFAEDIHKDTRCTYQECKEAGLTSFAAIPLIRKGQALGTIGLASFGSRDFSKNRRFLESVAADIAIALENSLYFEQARKSAVDLELQLTRQQELEAQLVQAQKMDAIGTLAGGIAHDFNNLLAIIKGNIDLLQVKKLSPEGVMEKVEQIDKTVSRATDLVRQILSFSRQKSLNSEAIDLNLAVNENVKFLRSTIPTTVEILKTLHDDPIIINVDNTQLQQVLLNLCNNAVHAMNSKGLLKISLGKLTLSAEQLPVSLNMVPGCYAKLSVSDSGVGMDNETLKKIFDPFFTTKEVGTGSGLGLSLVHGIVRAHGGFITVDSKPGQGSTFDLFFPVSQEKKDRSNEKQIATLRAGEERVLFVDDEETLANIGSEMLEHLGYKVTSVTSSVKALQLFRAEPQAFDLVFTDQTMPEMSGMELAAELVKIRPDIPIILCSGYSAIVSEENLKEKGIRKFIKKPLSMELLAFAAREALDGEKIPF
ncbi:MAG: ATP-binding protein [Deltaproteobacteria bacterium]|jgi:signal transduction histidine kinase/ActR/RegA family two-component response regulator|nr:ATP-binding protein [Deltaproteobacteria bacterium]